MNPLRWSPLVCGLCLLLFSQAARAQGDRRIPTSRNLEKLVEEYLAADEAARERLREGYDSTYQYLRADRSLPRLREKLLEIADERGLRIEKKGTHELYGEPGRQGKYIVRDERKGSRRRRKKDEPGDAMFIGLHGGGVGSGDAGSMASGMRGGGYVWVFPEVLEKTERGWVDSGTDQFVLELADAARRTFGIDPNRVYITGHSMGGHGTWSLAAHHPDIFAGGAAYAGGPTPYFKSPSDHTVVDLELGLLPNLYSQRFLFFQSADDPRVPPGPNDYAAKALADWKKRYPDGFDYRYVRVEDRGHAAPAEGYLPTQNWVAENIRNPLPAKFLWQPSKLWKRQYYWLYWHEPKIDSLLMAEVKDNRIDIQLLDPKDMDPGRMTLFLGEPLIDLEKEVVVAINGEERFRGEVRRTLSALLWGLPRGDSGLLFDARVDIRIRSETGR